MICVVKWQRVAFVLVLIVLCQLCVTVYLMFGSRESDKRTSAMGYTVVVDAGHGGIDGGVVAADGTKESDLNLAYAKQLGQTLERSGFNVVYTRKTSAGLYGIATDGFKRRDMLARKRIVEACSPNLVISVHMNKYVGAQPRKGPQVFYQKGDDRDKAFADCLQRVFNDFTGNTHSALGGDYFMCRETSCVSVIVECGFLSNAEETALLKTDDYRATFCNEILRGVLYYLSEEKLG